MIGAILGDIVGSVYEFNNIKTKQFILFSPNGFFTDDTVMTVAVADALLFSDTSNIPAFQRLLVERMHLYGTLYPDRGYGNRFLCWLNEGDSKPYNSFGNGSAMRVSPVAFYARTLDEALLLAQASAAVTHNHPEGIKGACATAGAIFLAKSGESKQEIRRFIERYYNMSFTLDDIRPSYRFYETCEESVPQALEAFLESESFEDAIRCAISIGGDSDTVAAITGGVAEAFYGIPKDLKKKTLAYLDPRLLGVVKQFTKRYTE